MGLVEALFLNPSSLIFMRYYRNDGTKERVPEYAALWAMLALARKLHASLTFFSIFQFDKRDSESQAVVLGGTLVLWAADPHGEGATKKVAAGDVGYVLHRLWFGPAHFSPGHNISEKIAELRSMIPACLRAIEPKIAPFLRLRA